MLQVILNTRILAYSSNMHVSYIPLSFPWDTHSTGPFVSHGPYVVVCTTYSRRRFQKPRKHTRENWRDSSQTPEKWETCLSQHQARTARFRSPRTKTDEEQSLQNTVSRLTRMLKNTHGTLLKRRKPATNNWRETEPAKWNTLVGLPSVVLLLQNCCSLLCKIILLPTGRPSKLCRIAVDRQTQ